MESKKLELDFTLINPRAVYGRFCRVSSSVVDPGCFIPDPDPNSLQSRIPDPDPNNFHSGSRILNKKIPFFLLLIVSGASRIQGIKKHRISDLSMPEYPLNLFKQ
jgi:hypothetical protein